MMYYINDGVYASFNCLFYDHADCFPILIGEQASAQLYKSSLWGPTCDGLDVIQKECYLPEIETGAFMVFKNMGAYTISGAVPFNGIPLARCIYTASTSWSIIKNAFDEQPAESANILMLAPCAATFDENVKLSKEDTAGGLAANAQDCQITC